PVAVADSYSTNQNTALVVAAAGVLTNDTDAQANSLTAVLNGGPSHGSLNLSANGGFTYTPTTGYSGADSFTYHANDGSLNSNIVTASINVLAVNTAPVAAADSYSTNQGTALVVSAAGVLSNDTDAQANSLTAVLNVGPSHGSVTLNANGGFTYTPTASYSGADSFTYHANDGSLDSNIVTVSISVLAPSSDVLANGSFEADFTGWTATGNEVIKSTAPYLATDGVKLVAFNSGNLTPDAVLTQTFATVTGQTYTLTFDTGVIGYVKKQQKLDVTVTGAGSLVSKNVIINSVSDGVAHWISKSYSFVADSTTATLTFADRSTTTDALDLLLDKVRVTGPPAFANGAPTAVADAYSINKDSTLTVTAPGILTNDTDLQLNILTAVLENGPSHGSLTLSASGGFTYKPTAGYSGADSFTYHANDGSLDSNSVTVNLTVNSVVPGLLVNPSFESGFTGWTATGNQSIEFYPTTDGIRMVAFNGQNLTPNAVLSQTFATTVGQTYSLTFDAAVLAYTSDPQTLQVSTKGTGNLLTQSITLTGSDGVIRWLPQAYSFTADSTSTTLIFRDLSTATIGLDLLLDNVRVVAAPSGSIASFAIPPVAAPSLGTPSISVAPGDAVISMIAPHAGNYVLEASEDLQTWQIIDSIQCYDQEPIEFHDPTPLGTEAPRPKLFYRIGLQPDSPAN
ncbi:MAG: Ig-like domain-containing protein, partial [Luteolibacter sp.]